jgi:hypothetical protein
VPDYRDLSPAYCRFGDIEGYYLQIREYGVALFKRADPRPRARVRYARCCCDGGLKFDTFMLMIAAEVESVDGLGFVVIEKFLDPDILREVPLTFRVLRCFSV